MQATAQQPYMRWMTPVLAVFRILALAAVYHLAARLGLKLAYVQLNTSPVWPPTGIALAALLAFGLRLWPGVSLGVFLGSVLTGAPLALALGMSLGNTLEAVTGALVLRRYLNFHNEIDRIQDVVGLVAVAVVSTAISATFGATTLALTGLSEPGSFGSIWITWWVGDLLGALVVTPVLLVWTTASASRPDARQAAEGVALIALLSLTTLYVFSDRPSSSVFHQALIYLIFPFILWAALRFGQRGASAAIVLISGIAIAGTIRGVGPFALQSTNDSLVLLQTFTGVVSLTALILAAATIERRKAASALRQRADELVTLNESSRIFLDNAELPGIYQAICQLAVTRLNLDATWIETDGRGALAGELAAAYGVPMEQVPDIKSRWQHRLLGGMHSTEQVRTVDDLENSIPAAEPHQALAAVPLLISGRPFGMLNLLSRDKEFFTPERMLLIKSYANLAAVVIQNSWLFDEVRQSNRQLHALSQRLFQAQEQERLHLSRELHDESGQLLTALMVQLGLLERDADQPQMLVKRLGELKDTTREIQDNLHRLAVDLRPASLDHVGLVTALQQYVQDFREQYGLRIEFEAVGMTRDRLPTEVETAIFRIVQESLTNVIRHAQATRVDIILSGRASSVAATIEDDGVGFHSGASTFEEHLGLFGMRERVEMLGGSLSVESSPGKGTTINVEVPWDA